MAEYTPPTGYEPNVLDDFRCSQTTEMIFQEESGDKDTEPAYLCDVELDDETIGKSYLHHCSFRSEENQRTEDKLITLMKKVCCQFSPFSRTQERGDPVHELSSCRQKPSREMENETIRILLERQKEQILAEVRTETQKHEFQADSDKRSFQELNGIIESSLACDEQLRRDQLLLHESLSEQHRDLREAHMKSLNEMEELSRFQELRIDESSRRSWIENQDTINELTARIQELQNEVNCLNDSRDFKDAESVRSGQSHVASQPVFFPTSPRSSWNAKPFSGNAEPQKWAAKHLGHTWYIGKRFCRSTGVFFMTLSRRIQSVDFR